MKENEGRQLGFAEKTGANVRNVGIFLFAIAFIPISALEVLLLPGAGLAASGEIFRQVNKNDN